MKITSTRISNSGEKSDVPVYPYAIISFPYVRGERNAITWPICGMADIGIKTPEMKMSGSRTVLSMDITSPTFSVGYAANRVPSVAKQNAVSAIAITRTSACTIGVLNTIIPKISGRHAIPRLYRKPLELSPMTSEWSEIGADSSRSKVFTRRSMGIETGSIDEAEKRRVIEISPGMRVPGGAFFPIAKARNMKSGKRMPITMMLGLR
jgi:hypothetical protein